MIANLEPAAAKSAAPTYQLKIVLLGAEPSIWRTPASVRPGPISAGSTPCCKPRWVGPIVICTIFSPMTRVIRIRVATKTRGLATNRIGMRPRRRCGRLRRRPARSSAMNMILAIPGSITSRFRRFCRRRWHHRPLFGWCWSLSAGGLRRHLGLSGTPESPEESKTSGAQAHEGVAWPSI